MDQCRLCLKFNKLLKDVFEIYEGSSYASMIEYLSDICIKADDKFSRKICNLCSKKLKHAFDFKKLIMRSDVTLHTTLNIKKINFNNIHDIKFAKKMLENVYKAPKNECRNICETHFKSGKTSIVYKNTTIKKVEGSCKIEVESINILDIYKYIKPESNNHLYVDDQDDVASCNYEPDLEKFEDCSKKIQGKKKSRTNKENWWFTSNPIKPVYLADIRLKTTLTMRRQKSKISTSKGKRKDICSYCGKMTSNVRQHSLLHTGERKYRCHVCDKGFFTEKMLDYHLKRHTKKDSFKCDQCVASLSSKGALKSHMLFHSEERKYVCDICNKAFKRKPALARHHKIHYFGNKSIKCDLCSMSFYTKYNLRNHMRVHTRERPYNCEICSQPYSYKHDFNRHCFKKHGVFLKRRSVYIMNEEFLKQEQILMRDLMLKLNGVSEKDTAINPFHGPQAALAFEQTIKALEARQILTDFQF